VFQDAYTCLQLTNLLDSTLEIIAIRPEGAQDVDLLYADGREEYVQLKDEPSARYTMSSLCTVLQNFAVDLLEAGRSATLTFILVARSNNIDDAVGRFKEGKATEQDIKTVAKLLSKGTSGSPVPRCLAELSELECLSLTRQLLGQTRLGLGRGDEEDGMLSFEGYAHVKLAKHGITDLQNAFNTLKESLDKQSEFSRSDVDELLKRFAGSAAIDLFEKGHVEMLTDDALMCPVDPKHIQQFYLGAGVDWKVIGMQGDIERDQQGALIEMLREPSDKLRFVCIVAEPAAGKSTVARRVVANLHSQYGALVIRILDNEDADVWYRMADFSQRIRRPFYVLVDDLFRSPDVVRAIRELDSSLPITVLATSRSNEYRPSKLNDDVERVALTEPSREEKERILRKLGKSRSDLTPEQRRRLDATNQFLILMMEVKEGKKLDKIIEEILERLKQQDESAYRAYEYLCFSYRHSLSTPASLLERLDGNGRFYKLPERKTVERLVFYDDQRVGNVRVVGHPVIAEAAYNLIYEPKRSPINVLQEIVTTVKTADWAERRYIAHLLRILARKDSSFIRAEMLKFEPFMTQCLQSASSVSELYIWIQLYGNLGQYEAMEHCTNIALGCEPVTVADCNLILKFCRQRGRERDALTVLYKYVHEHPKAPGAWAAYLGLVERHGTDKEGNTAINETQSWFDSHPDDTYVRTTYLGLVERKGTVKQVDDVLRDTRRLDEHLKDTTVRAAYLGLVERKGTAKQVENVLRNTRKWLSKSLKDTNVRTAYMGLVERKGSDAQVEKLLKDTRKWLNLHSDYPHVHDRLIILLLTLHRVDEALVLAKTAIKVHLKDRNIATRYLGLMQDLLDEHRVRELYAQLINDYRQDIVIRNSYGRWLHHHGYMDEAESVFMVLVEEHPRSMNPRHSYGRLLLDMGRYEEAVEQFRRALVASHDKHQMAHDGLAKALCGLARIAEEEGNQSYANQYFDKAEQEYFNAIHWAEDSGESQAVFYTHLGWFHNNRHRWLNALAAFERAMFEDEDFYGNYWGKGHALVHTGDFRSAEDLLRTAIERAPDSLPMSALEEIHELLEQCRVAIEHLSN